MTPQKGADYWTKRISDQEMPALCSTVLDLERLAKDDVSSLSLLGRSVMHDNALTSRILRVANSAIYNKGISQVSTVSRAAVVLGFDTIRNICLTAKLLTSLLENKHLSEGVYQRLLKLMAQSFQAAMLARMMMSDKGESLREEVFIASLLYRIGESAFWSMGGEQTEQLDKKLLTIEDNIEQKSLIRAELGTSFPQLTQSIARSWGLGEVLIKSLAQPDERMPEIRCIFLANKLSEIVSQPNVNAEELHKRLSQAADMLDISVDEFTQRFIDCSDITHKLAIEYGAKAIVSYLPNTGDVLEKADSPIEPTEIRQTNQGYQLRKLRQLTHYAVEKTDFNQIMHTTLEGMLTGVGLDRCGVLLLSPSRKLLQPRVMMGDGAELLKQAFVIELDDPTSVFTQCVGQKKSFWVNTPTSNECKVQVDDVLVERFSQHGFLLAPLCVGHKVLGLFYADRQGSERHFEQEDFDSFTHFSELANVCFRVSMT
ncbi:HDOD domain-containing protein [Shewanella psychromarinicola]|uniref:HDOD domain-containing protein n=2 Tax=Shewanella psychromarinicola TaxID=2487742 RepID=A0A3N4EAB0_9GAMM|nr:HDOD domain-containing protein [Shewanella psychromarinicola]AZG37592.1 HDOD domain-containing protein [Shewanella psychromarinicola]MCL1081090.1 HDOD domain-containing protein [Shewanella psychromarinicola]RPA35145.1 HDOD domain-containing protein [Shewanella psychromarinicola]